MIGALVRLGWTPNRVVGGPRVLARPGHAPVTVPVRKGATPKEGTSRSTLRQAGIGEDESLTAGHSS